MVAGHQGIAWYVDRSSLNVQKYAPPQYIIAINVVSAESADGTEWSLYRGGAGKITGVKTYRYFYNWDRREMYIDSTGRDGWRYVKPLGSWAETGLLVPTGEMAFALAYNLRFYGSRAGFDDEFYDRI